MSNKNAQAWGIDLTVAVIVFIIGMIVFYVYIINYPNQGEESIRKLQYEAEIISENILSEGLPENWDTSNVIKTGIITDGRINQTKLEEFYNLVISDYNRTKRLFRIKNDYYIRFQNPILLGGLPVNEIGLNNTNPENLAKITRVTIYENNITSISFHTWN